jgi:hypothetical protein
MACAHASNSPCDDISAIFARLLGYGGAVAVIAAMAAKVLGGGPP